MFVCVNAFYLRKSGENSMRPGLNLRCSSCNRMAGIASLLRFEIIFLAIKIHVVFGMEWTFMFRKMFQMFQQGGC